MFRQFQMAFDEVTELRLGRGVVEVCIPQGSGRYAAQVAHLVLLQEVPSPVGAFAQITQAAFLADVHHLLFHQIVQITFGRGFAVHALIDTQGAPRAQHLIRPIAQLQRHGLGGG
ncbi:hypothetical protein D3C76_768530 [compost metagenome]